MVDIFRTSRNYSTAPLAMNSFYLQNSTGFLVLRQAALLPPEPLRSHFFVSTLLGAMFTDGVPESVHPPASLDDVMDWAGGGIKRLADAKILGIRPMEYFKNRFLNLVVIHFRGRSNFKLYPATGGEVCD